MMSSSQSGLSPLRSIVLVWGLLFLSVFAQARVARADLPALATADWPVPPVQGSLPEHAFFHDINLFSKTLFGLSLSSGPLTLQYDEGNLPTAWANHAANFTLHSYTFDNGLSIEFPQIDNINGLIRMGALWYGLSGYRLIDDDQNFHYRTLTQSGRYVLLRPTEASPELHDTLLRISYQLEEYDCNPDCKMRPHTAKFSEGEEVAFTWNDQVSSGVRAAPASLRLTRDGDELERVDFQWWTSGVPRLRSAQSYLRGNAALWRWVFVVYESAVAFPGIRVHRMVQGADENGPLAVGITPRGVRISYLTAGGSDAISALSNYQNKLFRTYGLTAIAVPETGQIRTVYSSVREGSVAQGSSSIQYLPFDGSSRPVVRITEPDAAGDPTTLALHPLRGIVLEERVDSCPEPLRSVELHTSGAATGQLYRETQRPRCTDAATQTFFYDGSGFLSQVDTTAANELGNVVTKTIYTQSVPAYDMNGVRGHRVSSVSDALGNGVRWNYTVGARLESVEDLTDGAITTLNYDYLDSAGRYVYQVTTTAANGRQDKIQSDTRGNIVQTTAADSSALQNSVAFTRDGYDRLQSIIDGRNNIRTFEYMPDGRVDFVDVSAGSGSEERKTSYLYHADFPATVLRETARTQRAGGYFDSYLRFNFLNATPVRTSAILGGTNTSELTSLYRVLDPLTLQPTLSCVWRSAAGEGCTSFSYYTSGILRGNLQRADVAGGIAAGGYSLIPAYDSHANLIGETRQDAAFSRTTRSEFDGFGRLKQVTIAPGDPQVETVSRFFYDAGDRLVRQQTTLDNVLVADQGLQYGTGSSPRLDRMTDLMSGAYLTLAYEAAPTKRLTETRAFDSAGRLHSSILLHPENYDLFDRSTSQDLFIDGIGSTTRTSQFDNNGDVRVVRDDNGNIIYYDYDSFGRLIHIEDSLMALSRDFGVSAGLNQETVTTWNRTSNPALAFTETLTRGLDAHGRVLTMDNATTGESRSYDYNPRGFLDGITSSFLDAPPRQFTQSFDVLGRAIESRLNGALTSGKTLSGLGLLTQSLDGRSNPTAYRYDGLLRLSEIDYPDGSRWQRTGVQNFWPALSGGVVRRVTEVDRGGTTNSIEFNSDGNPLKLTTSGGSLGNSTTTYAYSGSRASAVTSSDSGRSATSTFEYDSAGRKIRESTQITSSLGSSNYSLRRAYDSKGRLIQFIYPDPSSSRVDYQRDSFGRLDRVSLNGSQVAQYYYDGPVQTRLDLGDVTRNFYYDSTFGTLLNVTDWSPQSQLVDLHMTYDTRRSLRGKTDFGLRRSTGSAATETYNLNAREALDAFSYSNPVLGSASRSYSPGADGIIGLVNPGIDSMFKLPSRFSYDSYGRPTLEHSSNRTFGWSPHGLRSLSIPGVGLTASFLQDALGRTVSMTKNYGSNSTRMLQLRERGMALFTNEDPQ